MHFLKNEIFLFLLAFFPFSLLFLSFLLSHLFFFTLIFLSLFLWLPTYIQKSSIVNKVCLKKDSFFIKIYYKQLIEQKSPKNLHLNKIKKQRTRKTNFEEKCKKQIYQKRIVNCIEEICACQAKLPTYAHT